VYANRKDELLARFPLAGPHGRTGCGIPYSVFMPVDNLARHWFGEYRKTGVKKYLGPVLHAIQDASIPQHAAGCMGNWHDEYENCLDAYAPRFYQNRVFRQEVAGLLAAWDRIDANPPLQRLLLKDRQRTPARNWDISQLVPWTALQAYHAYVDAYFNFRRGFKVNARSLRRLYALALAMSAHILHHAQRISISIPAKAS
jgi:hypothetical protein